MGETTGGVLRRGPDRIIGGVCSGLAIYFGVDPLLVRIVFVILALIPPGIGIGVLLYLALWFLMEPPEGAPTSATRNIGARLRAMGDEVREDFRTGFRTHPTGAATPTSPAGVPASPPSQGRGPGATHGDRPRGLWLGIILIVIGAYFLAANLGWFRLIHWEIVGPVILIAAGLLFLARRR
ncbi:MAG TPA: PspC domain-containing protein [Candidatus Dormibacteraeota bacterium]|nr:PspC domain-containing protein [Candidatus Dormibacteraeota bacterium]